MNNDVVSLFLLLRFTVLFIRKIAYIFAMDTELNQELNKDQDPEMLDEYDFSGGVRGKYGRFAKGRDVVVVEPDISQVFTDIDRDESTQ